MNAFQSARWIWLPQAHTLPQKNIFARFRTVFNLENPSGSVKLAVAVSGNYACRVNGKLAAFGQYTDYPARKTRSVTAISEACKIGRNELEMLVHFAGNEFFSHLDGEPGMIAEVSQGEHVLACSGADWRCAPDHRYEAGERDKVSSSLNYTFAFHADRTEDPETGAEVLPWKDWMNTCLRPTEPPVDQGFLPAKKIASGRLARGGAEAASIGEIFRADRLDVPPEASNGFYERYDLGRETAGFLEFELTAPAGTVVDIAHGEYLAGGRVPAFFEAGRRNFTDRYVAKAGRQSFLHPLRRLGCRYLEFHILGDPADVVVHTAGIRITALRGMDTPPFRCDDVFFERAHEVSAETLRLCLHEKYENCPWREQSICMYDARNQMLFGYPLWGNYVFAAAMLRLFGQSLRRDGFLAVAVPSAMQINIPSYTFLWFTAIFEYIEYSGDLSLFREFKDQIAAMFEKILALRKNGLFMPPEQDLWNYCEAPDLEFCENPPNAFYNLYLREALLDMERLFRRDGDGETASVYGAAAYEIAENAESYFYDPERGLYADGVTDSGVREVFHGHIQALFLAQGLVPPDRVPHLVSQILEEKIPFPALGTIPYLIRGVFQYGSADDRRRLHLKLKQHYGLMLDAGAQTWWEVILGIGYAAGAGSLCHGWSAAPAFYESACILGVVPLDLGFRRFRVKPCSCGLRSASGSVMTPHGRINIRWERKDGGLAVEVDAPDGCIPVAESFPEDPILTFRLNPA